MDDITLEWLDVLWLVIVPAFTVLVGYRRLSRRRSLGQDTQAPQSDKEGQGKAPRESGRNREKLDEELAKMDVEPAHISDDPSDNASRLDAIAAERARKRRQRE